MGLVEDFIRKTKKDYFNNYLDRLSQYPFQAELDPESIRNFGRAKQIRMLTKSKPPKMYINNNSIGIPSPYKLLKLKNGWKLKKFKL